EEFLACYKKDTNVTITRNYHLSDIRHNFANTTKISTLLNFKPPITFKEGIKEFVHWVNTQTIKKDRYHESIAEMKQKGLFK
ncbi:MAG: epimerase, partial [Bacteroidia bacterium]